LEEYDETHNGRGFSGRLREGDTIVAGEINVY
jgi:hypothetical protein